jgi:hypothetical protein
MAKKVKGSDMELKPETLVKVIIKGKPCDHYYNKRGQCKRCNQYEK